MKNEDIAQKIIDSLTNHPEEWKEGDYTYFHESGLGLWGFEADLLNVILEGNPSIWEPYRYEGFTISQRIRIMKAIKTAIRLNKEKKAAKDFKKLVEFMEENF
jgi:hypothetical protein